MRLRAHDIHKSFLQYLHDVLASRQMGLKLNMRQIQSQPRERASAYR